MSRARRKQSHLTGLRVRLRAERDADPQVVHEFRDTLPECDATGERLIVERRSDGEAVGFVEFSRDESEKGWATFGAIVMAEGERGWGYGSEAVRLIEDELAAKAKVKRLRAKVPKNMGLAFYFWLRQGYHPAAPEEVFWPDEGEGDMIWVVRRRTENQGPRTKSK